MTTNHNTNRPGIIYGTAWKQERTATLVEQAIELGFRGIDTACQPKHYHEAGVGEGVATSLRRGLVERTELYLQSKFTPLDGQDPARVPYDPRASLSEQVAQSLQMSLKNLQTSYLDCLVLHSPLANPAQTLTVWQAMEQLHDAGGVKQLGLSNCYHLQQLEQLYHAARIKPAVLQNRFYAATQYDQTIRAFCHQQQISYQSFWTLSANPRILAHPTLQALAKKYRRTAAQLFFRYVSQVGIVPLTGTTSTLHMQEDLAIFEFELTPGECEAITALL
ncbi:MAG: aldo/keto reductase [Magnetococcales bacterium]|nr:aldo/keto reductase [Magnetococcales bacterium]